VAREHGAHVMDCLAEAVTNDPFNSGGTPGQQKLARWFRDIWVLLGSPRHSYIRGIHYRMGSLGTVRLPFGRFNGRKTGPPLHRLEDIERLEREHPEWKLYIFDPTCYDLLGEAANEARNTGLVPMGAVEDHRNPDPVIFAEPMPEAGSVYVTYEQMSMPWLPSLPPARPWYALADYHEGDGDLSIQRNRRHYHLEIWCEKSDIETALRGLCEAYGANFIAGMGELSIRAVQDFMARIKESGRPAARVLYISDLDGNGVEMPKSIGTKIAWTLKHQMEREGGEWRDIGLHPIALTLRQVRDLDLPSIAGTRPSDGAKTSQHNNFERVFGVGGKVELDALDAAASPHILLDIVRAWLQRYLDATLPERIRDTRTEVTQLMRATQAEVYARHQAAYDDLVAAHRALVEQVAPLFAAYTEKASEVDRAIRADLEADLETLEDAGMLPDFPEAQDAGEDEWDALFYHSRRDYWQQLQAYKAKLIEVHGLDGGQADAALLTRSEKKRINRATQRKKAR